MNAGFRRTGALVTALAATFVMSGCSHAGSTTCADFKAETISDQTSTLHDLLSEHDLDPNDFGNIQGVARAVDSFCAQNSSSTLDSATDWNSSTW